MKVLSHYFMPCFLNSLFAQFTLKCDVSDHVWIIPDTSLVQLLAEYTVGKMGVMYVLRGCFASVTNSYSYYVSYQLIGHSDI